ncbi:MAG: spermidine/putrescine ABC transporter substrate-binding protein [Planctomycetota bacterium]|jgi:spermidine/putrescine transport system substrate-binding protein|nr:spermidine/putrescine ABC transporter substrate-binding protein [Planctomycetota bacterium]
MSTRLTASLALIFFFLAPLAQAVDRTPILHVYTWSDYFDPDVLELFEETYGCRVALDYFDSNEAMYAKLKAGGGGYDIITPSSYMSEVMHSQDMLLPIDHSQIPNLQYIDHTTTKNLLQDPEMLYSVSYTRTVSGIGFNRVQIGSLPPTWGVFGKTGPNRRMTMLNDMRETIGAALKFLGYRINTIDDKELEEAGDLLIEWKANLSKFDVDEAKIGLGSGEFTIIHSYNGDVALIMSENKNIDFLVPEEGASVTFDDMVIMADSEKVDLAHAFINHLLDPDNAAANMEGILYYMPNAAALEKLSDDFRNNVAFRIPDAVMEKCEVIHDLGDDNAKYIRVWDRVKAGE